jgi:hypothetical protein
MSHVMCTHVVFVEDPVGGMANAQSVVIDDEPCSVTGAVSFADDATNIGSVSEEV